MSPRFLIISHSFQGIHPFFGRKIFRLKSCSITKGRGPGAAPGPLSNRSPTRSRGNSHKQVGQDEQPEKFPWRLFTVLLGMKFPTRLMWGFFY